MCIVVVKQTDLAPAQATSWINLASTYTANRDYKMALVALNVTSMAHGPEFRLPEMPKPKRITNNNEVRWLLWLWELD